MTDEEYQRIKEAEKERLRSVQQLKQVQRALRRQQSLRDALEGLAASRDKLDASGAATDQLAAETARHEARLDLALDAQREKESDAADAEISAEDLKEADRTRRARDLVRQLKQEIGLPPGSSGDAPSDASGDNRPARPGDTDRPAENRPAEDRPDKTIGRM